MVSEEAAQATGTDILTYSLMADRRAMSNKVHSNY